LRPITHKTYSLDAKLFLRIEKRLVFNQVLLVFQKKKKKQKTKNKKKKYINKKIKKKKKMRRTRTTQRYNIRINIVIDNYCRKKKNIYQK